MRSYILSLLVICGSGLFAQIPCEKGFRSDSVVINRFTYSKEPVELMEVTIKNNYQLQFIRKGQATFLKIIVRDNLGFGQIGEFMLYCGKKQIYTKDMKLVSIDKSSGYFVIELNPSYIQTIRDFGVNKMIFRDTVEFLVPKSDSEKIKQTASCFYDAITPR
jgi:hypothetical protein